MTEAIANLLNTAEDALSKLMALSDADEGGRQAVGLTLDAGVKQVIAARPADWQSPNSEEELMPEDRALILCSGAAEGIRRDLASHDQIIDWLNQAVELREQLTA